MLVLQDSLYVQFQSFYKMSEVFFPRQVGKFHPRGGNVLNAIVTPDNLKSTLFMYIEDYQCKSV